MKVKKGSGRVPAARAAGRAAAARQPSFAKALGTPPPQCPRGRSAPPRRGQRRGSPRGDRRGCQLNRLPQKWKRSQKKAAGKDKSSAKKVQTKGKRGAKGKQAEVANQETKEDVPAENRETKNEKSPASDEAGEKEATLINITHPVLSVVPVSLLVQSRGIFLSTIL